MLPNIYINNEFSVINVILGNILPLNSYEQQQQQQQHTHTDTLTRKKISKNLRLTG